MSTLDLIVLRIGIPPLQIKEAVYRLLRIEGGRAHLNSDFLRMGIPALRIEDAVYRLLQIVGGRTVFTSERGGWPSPQSDEGGCLSFASN